MCGEKGVVDLCHVEVNGITPAYAGKRKPPPDRHKNWGDHPRMCGEKLLISAYFRFKRGSPPAYAGKSWRASKKPPGSSDHPRVCEEKNFLLLMTSRRSGSPPRVRGKAPMGPNNPLDVRITPAYAGKRTTYVKHLQFSRDHPRVCGEKCPPGKFFFMTVGSPPRVREKPHPASDRKLGRVRGTKRSSGPAPAAAPAGLAGSCPASPPWSYPPRSTVSRPRP